MRSLGIVSKHRGVIYGLSILWVVLFHYQSYSVTDLSFGISGLEWLSNFAKTGNIGVDVFLLMSGVCLYFSFKSDSDHYSFIKKRLSRVVIPALAIFMLWWLYELVFTTTLWSFVSRVSLMGFWMTGYRSMWFVSFIIVMYFLYPYLNRFLFADEGRYCVARTAFVVVAVIVLNFSFMKVNPGLFSEIEVGLCRIPVFVIGCCMGKFVYEKKELGAWWPALMISVTVLFFILTNTDSYGEISLFCQRVLYMAVAAPICFSMAYLSSFLSGLKGVFFSKIVAFLSFCGGISMEIYLMHIVLNYWFKLTPFWHKGCTVEYAFLAVLSILLSWGLSKVQAPLIRRLSGRG